MRGTIRDAVRLRRWRAGPATAMLAGLLAAAACGNTPVGPTGVEGPRQAPPVSDGGPASAEPLRWDRVAPGCTPQQPVPDLGELEPVTREERGAGVIFALWQPSGGRAIMAEFRLSGDEWALCWWDTTGV